MKKRNLDPPPLKKPKKSNVRILRRYCKARQYSDQMVCDQCQLKWDANDPDPPECEPF